MRCLSRSTYSTYPDCPHLHSAGGINCADRLRSRMALGMRYQNKAAEIHITRNIPELLIVKLLVFGPGEWLR